MGYALSGHLKQKNNSLVRLHAGNEALLFQEMKFFQTSSAREAVNVAPAANGG